MLLKCHSENFHLQLRKQVSKHARKLTASCRKYDNFSHLCPPQEKKKEREVFSDSMETQVQVGVFQSSVCSSDVSDHLFLSHLSKSVPRLLKISG